MKDIPGFEGLYGLTSCGRVWSYRSKKFLQSKTGNHFYLSVNGKQTHINTYYLLAELYFPEIANNTEYKFTYKDDNISVSNFIYFDKSYYSFDVKNGRIPYYYNFKREVIRNV